MTEAERFDKAAEIYVEALELEDPERANYLATACNGDTLLLAEVQKLLGVAPIPNEEIIGSYRILRELGSGGMGMVHLAERIDDYRQRVAIKRFRGDVTTGAEITSRFLMERQILATLTHPSIVRLLDGGSTRLGRPYLVMEYVEDGLRLDHYCWQQKLPLRARVELFLHVCDAVQHAHQKLIVHRDLKPGNILITPKGEVKLLDFGLAKVVDEARWNEIIKGHSIVGRQLGTPGYASPEQLLGTPSNDIRTDVYSLGAILYKLLCGQEPHSLASSNSWEEFRRMVCESDPSRPSASVQTQEGPPEDSIHLRHALEGDLDLIALKALERKPEDRYARVEDLADDLRAWLEYRPIKARRQSAFYRLKKFTRRHRVGVAVAAMLIATLVAGVWATLYQAHIARIERTEAQYQRDRAEAQARRADQERQRAEREQLRAEDQSAEATRQRAAAEQGFNDVRHLSNSLIFELHDAVHAIPGATNARQLLITRALEYLDRLAAQASQPDLLLELAQAYERLGDVQNSLTTSSTGNATAALASHRKALALRTRAAAGPRELASSHSKISDALSVRGETAAALAEQKTALTLLARAPENAQTLADRSTYESHLADLIQTTGNTMEARAMHQHSLETAKQGAARFPSDPRFEAAINQQYMRIGDSLRRSGDIPAALDSYKKALSRASIKDAALSHMRIASVYRDMANTKQSLEEYALARQAWQRLADADPKDANAQDNLATVITNLGETLNRAGNKAQALKENQSALDIYLKLSAADPGNTAFQEKAAQAYRNVGDVLAEVSKNDEALEAYRKQSAILEKLSQADPKNTSNKSNLAIAYGRIANVLLDLPGDHEEILPLYNKQLEIFKSLAVQDPGDLNFRANISFSLERIARYYASMKEPAKAVEWSVKAVENWKTITLASPRNVKFLRNYAVSLGRLGNAKRRLGDLDGAIASLRASAEASESILRIEPTNTDARSDLSITHGFIGQLLMQRKDYAASVAQYRISHELSRSLAAENPSNLLVLEDSAWSLSRLAAGLKELHKDSEAKKDFEETIAIYEKLRDFKALSVRGQANLCISYADILSVSAEDEKCSYARKAQSMIDYFDKSNLDFGEFASIRDIVKSTLANCH